jgi:hypothetical protein
MQLPDGLVRDERGRQGRQEHPLLPEREKLKSRNATFGFSDEANIDKGAHDPDYLCA